MQILTETQFTKALCDNLSCNKDGNDLSPEPSGSRSLPPDMWTGTIPSPRQPQPNTACSAPRHKKPTDNGPKIKKLKYHQYIPPDQRGSKEPPPWVDSSSSILQQQQLLLQLLILSQQQQGYHPDLAGPSSRPQKVQLDKMKVADLRSALKLRSLPVYGTKIDLVKRLRASEAAGGGGDASSPPAGGTIGPGAEGALQWHQTRQSADVRSRSSPFTNTSRPRTSAAGSVSSSHSSKTLSLQSGLAVPFPAASSPAHSSSTTADRDEMLREKDEQIEQLTMMLRQEQRLVEALKMQLEGGGQVSDPLVLVRGRQEPPDEPSAVPPLLSPPAAPCQMAVKQEAAQEIVSETLEFPQLLTREVQEQIVPQIRLERSNPKGATQYICLQRSTAENRLLRQQSRRQNQPKCRQAQRQPILLQPLKHKPLTKNTKHIKLLINLKQQQLFPPPAVPPGCHLQSDLQRRVGATDAWRTSWSAPLEGLCWGRSQAATWL